MKIERLGIGNVLSPENMGKSRWSEISAEVLHNISEDKDIRDKDSLMLVDILKEGNTNRINEIDRLDGRYKELITFVLEEFKKPEISQMLS